MRLDEAGLLGAFYANRDLILAAAAKVYWRGRKGSYDLSALGFLSESDYGLLLASFV